MKVCLVLTHQCNLACSYCYAGKKFNRHMSDETAWKGLKLLLQGTGDMELSFFGGEPFLRYDTMVAMSRVAREAARRSGRRLSIQVTTNATILEEKQLRFLEDYQVWTAFSVDGPEEIQDVARPFTNGRGSGRLVWRNIERALERLSRVHILMVVAPQTVDHLLPGNGVPTSLHLVDDLKASSPGFYFLELDMGEQVFKAGLNRKVGDEHTEQERKPGHQRQQNGKLGLDFDALHAPAPS